MTELQLTHTKAKEIAKELKISYGIITSPEEVKAFSLGLGLRGEYTHSKKEIINKYMTAIYGEISTPTDDLYTKYMSSQPKLRKREVPNFMRI